MAKPLHLRLVTEKPPEYRFKDKIRPFLRGLLTATPGVEVAIEGLRRSITEEQRAEYERRIEQGGSSEQIHAALIYGVAEPVQERMAVAFREAYRRALVSQMDKLSAVGQSAMNGHAIVSDGAQCVRGTMELVIRIVRSGKVTSENAQVELASMIGCDGTKEQARELLCCGKISSQAAVQILRVKTGEANGYDA